MINRTLVRTKVIQTLFSHYSMEEQTALTAKKNLLRSFSDTYSLYMVMLDLVNEMVSAAEQRIEAETERAKVLHQDYVPNLNFINNRFATQVFNNRQLRGYMEDNRLGWDAAHEMLNVLWKEILQSDCYHTYMQIDAPTYEDDKNIWRKIVTDVLADNDNLTTALEELEISLDKQSWTTDANVVLSYIIKTIKSFKEENGAEQPLLEMFDSEEELNFGKQLLKTAIDGHDEYMAMIERHLKNWDISRIAHMDYIILITALSEIINFPNIALSISINEYLEIAKEYSSEKSHKFINGILDAIITELKDQNKLIKAVVID